MLLIRELSLSIKSQEIFSNVSFSLSAGESLSILGPSGSGKTSLLRSIVGLETPQHGVVSWNKNLFCTDGKSLVPVEKRNFGLVFQDSALFPHLSVQQNVSFSLQKRSSRERKTITEKWLEKLHISHLRTRDVSRISGGERQRVALARAMAANPSVLFLDEPFSHVDRLDRLRLIDTIKEVFSESATIPVLVTHDARDAFELTNSVLMLRSGKVVQYGKTDDVKSNPENDWVKEFLAT